MRKDNNHVSTGIVDADALQACSEDKIRNARKPIRDIIVAKEVWGEIPDSFLFSVA